MKIQITTKVHGRTSVIVCDRDEIKAHGEFCVAIPIGRESDGTPWFEIVTNDEVIEIKQVA